MCGIFGIVSSGVISRKHLVDLSEHAQRRGRDSSGLFYFDGSYRLRRESRPVNALLARVDLSHASFAMGHSRLVTNGTCDNQPVFRDDVCVIHNGIVVNHDEVWSHTARKRRQQIDTEVIAALIADALEAGVAETELHTAVFTRCLGVVSCAIALPKRGQLVLMSNNGSLYVGQLGDAVYFSSEEYPLKALGCATIEQVLNGARVIAIPLSQASVAVEDINDRSVDLVPGLGLNAAEERLLEYRQHDLRRCTRCILPETMPFIHFNAQGVCNYCTTYKLRNSPKPVSEILQVLEGYRRSHGRDCIVPFSGGRDSCYSLHLIVKELQLKPIAYTYDWGMVTDLGRRNISRMCAALGVENIIVADDIELKRRNIRKNLQAWLKSPHLGMINILTAGDKHFFRHIETVKQQTGISLNLWGFNPLETTHFKTGFLGVRPDFEEEKVYATGLMKQLKYQSLRVKAMLGSPGYFNASLWDTLSGEYYRSIHRKTDYYQLFDYWRWDEKVTNEVLINEYDWELAPDTNTTWRIGDGTAAMYNYMFYTMAGFSEHDTFRSNQIREGDMTREEALALVIDENQPRYQNIKWYLDAIGLDFDTVIRIVNAAPKLPQLLQHAH